jgi:hypothetical protein
VVQSDNAGRPWHTSARLTPPDADALTLSSDARTAEKPGRGRVCHQVPIFI